ncbi:phage terminase small subunit [Actinosynnema sp. NPDC004786]
MGARGPIGKRSEARAGHRTKAEQAETEQVVVENAGPVEMPAPMAGWHRIAKDWYLSLHTSGQGRFMEPSDWQAATFVAEYMTKLLADEKFNARGFASIWSAMNDLLTTEGARRRVKLEINRRTPGEAHPDVPNLDDYRDLG